jgi:hypothetical protein
MKKYFLLCFVAILMVINPVMGQKDYKQIYEKKIHSFSKMRSAGWTMTGVGSGLAVAGTVLLATLPAHYWDYNNDYNYYNSNYNDDDYTHDTFQAVGGIICIGVGIGLLAGGITMGSISSHKVKSYQKKLDNLSVGMICTPNRQGFSLVYRF